MTDFTAIKILYLSSDGNLTLFGVPYGMRPGQAPRDLLDHPDNRFVRLSGADVDDWLDTLADVPVYPGEWCEVEYGNQETV